MRITNSDQERDHSLVILAFFGFSSRRDGRQIHNKDMQAYKNWQWINIKEIQGPKNSPLIIYS
jgi:hypothetical protein